MVKSKAKESEAAYKAPKFNVYVDVDKFRDEKTYQDLMDIILDSKMSVMAMVGMLEQIKLELLFGEHNNDD